MPLNKSAREYFDGLRRSYERLQDEVTKDDVHHFVVDAWHLIENIEKDTASTKPQRAAAGRLRADELIQICNMLCNKEKHRSIKGKVSKSAVVQTNWTIQRGYGIGRYGKGAFGLGEQSIVLECSDGTRLNALKFAEDVLKKFEPIFG